MALEKKWVCDSSDLVVYGEKIGYDSHDVCDWIYKCGLYGEDSSGSTIIYHSKTGSNVDIEDMQKIIDSLLDSVNIMECEVINDA